MSVKMVSNTHTDRRLHQTETVEGISGQELGHAVSDISNPGQKHNSLLLKKHKYNADKYVRLQGYIPYHNNFDNYSIIT